MTEDEMVGWHHQLNGHEFKQAQTLGVGDGQGSLACCNSWGRRELDTDPVSGPTSGAFFTNLSSISCPGGLPSTHMF